MVVTHEIDPNGSSVSEYQGAGQDPILIDEAETPLVADFSRDGTDLQLNWESGQEITVLDYFSTPYPPALITSSGARLDGELVSKLAGPGPMAQAQSSSNDESPIGEITALAGQVTVQHADGTSDELVDGSAVFKGDILQTGTDGSFGLLFIDDTKLSMGENGRVVLDELVYNSTGESSSFGISLLQGAFSVISGLIAKEDVDAVSINTPVGTIGIRGTSWAGKILAIGEESVFTLFSGSIVVANEGGSQLLNVLNQTVIVTSYSVAPSVPFLLNDERLLDIYGRILGQIDSKYDEEDGDFDPEAFNPEAGGPGGGGGSGGGASFQAFEILQAQLGQGLGELLGSGDLLGATQIDLIEQLAAEELLLVGDPSLPVVDVEVVTVSASGEIGADGFTVVIHLDTPGTLPTTVFYTVTPVGGDGSETSDLSFIGDGSLTIPAGETEGSVFISILEDSIIENTEFFRIDLTGADNATISPFFSGTLLVVEDDDIGVLSMQPDVGDDTPGVSLDGDTIVADEGAVVRFTVILDKALAPGVELSVDYAFSGTAVEGSDFTAPVIKTITFDGGADGLAAGAEMTVEISIIDDIVFEGDETFTITLLNASSQGEIDADARTLTVDVIDNVIPLTLSDEELVSSVGEDPSDHVAQDQPLGLAGGSGVLSSLTFDEEQSAFDALALSSGGVPLVLTGLGTDMLVAWAGEDIVFTATLNASGTYDVALVGPVDHPLQIPEPDVPETQTLQIPLSITVVDSNGTFVATEIFLDVADDVPQAVGDTGEVLEGSSVAGNVILDGVGADTDGLDGAEIASVININAETSVSTTNDAGDYVIRGAYGTLTLGADGGFEYIADGGLDNTDPLTDEFTYQLQDADGDSSYAVLSISIGDALTPTVGSVDNGVVDEHDVSAAVAAASGDIAVDFMGDGPGSVTLDASLLPALTVRGDNITYEVSEDGLSILGTVEPVPGEVYPVFSLTITALGSGAGFEYEFSLLDYLDHTAPANLPLLLDFHFTVEDQDGSQADGQFSVSVINDEPPVAGDDSVLTNAVEEFYIPDYALLANDTDDDEDLLFISSASGPASVSGDYVYVTGLTGDQSFEYSVSDGGPADVGEVSVQYFSDTGNLIGTDDSEIIIGGDGADTIQGGGGDDTIAGGRGDDIMDAQGGADVFHFKDTDDGEDEIFGFDIELDIINLDAVFDDLEIDGAAARAADVNLDVVGGNTVITIDEQAGFSITLNNIDLGNFDGTLSAQDLLARGISVGDES